MMHCGGFCVHSAKKGVHSKSMSSLHDDWKRTVVE